MASKTILMLPVLISFGSITLFHHVTIPCMLASIVHFFYFYSLALWEVSVGEHSHVGLITQTNFPANIENNIEICVCVLITCAKADHFRLLS